jgi:hypothetical protein
VDEYAGIAVRLDEQFARPASVSVHNAEPLASARERVERLQGALTARAVIDQAIGILRSRAGGSSEEAFARLARCFHGNWVRAVSFMKKGALTWDDSTC